jgi:molecular chaperone GrpE (heat shock protein)
MKKYLRKQICKDYSCIAGICIPVGKSLFAACRQGTALAATAIKRVVRKVFLPESSTSPEVETSETSSTPCEGIAAAPESPETTPVHSEEWLDLVKECCDLMDEIDELQRSYAPEDDDRLYHVSLRMETILDRAGLERIENETEYDVRRHFAPGEGPVPKGARIVETIRPGFRIDRRVLRRAHVKVEK